MSNKQLSILASAFSLSIMTGLILSHVFLQSSELAWTAAITLLTVILWVTEVIPIPATSLIPFALFPFAGVLTHKEVSAALGSHVILLLMGGFMLSKSLEKSGVHRRLAIYMVRLVGVNNGRRVVIGFMFAAALLSMWISNTAATLILLPIALAALQDIEDDTMAVALTLGIAYSASLGGVGTPIGTPPNIIFISIYQEATGKEIDFLSWMKTAVPIVLIGIPLMAFWLTRKVSVKQRFVLPELGAWRSAEKRVLIVFFLVALAWVTRQLWSHYLGLQAVGDSTIALLGVVLMFLIPNGETHSDQHNALLDWKTATDIPWGMLLLFAGGIAIAKAFIASGLSEKMGTMLTGLSTLPVFVLILSICLFVTFLTELTSNTATATLLMPILATAGGAAGIDPQLLMMPAAISASCAFMMPVATAPNAIVYSTNKFHIKEMAREGLVLNILLAFIISGVCYVSLAS
ncbi:MAG: DASS family sodium-coupled anion symporter [Methyloprofundus sp.]|nr:DASS family sodium-coupled anion symporter [Methyloprofundus sp.]